MENTLSLELTKDNRLDFLTENKNILSGVREAFSNSINKGMGELNIAEKYGNILKEKFESIDFKEMAEGAIGTALEAGADAIGLKKKTFESIKQIGSALKNGDLKQGLSAVLDMGIDSIKMPSVIKGIAKTAKNTILGNTLDNELEKVMTAQKKTISRIDKRCMQFDEALKKEDLKEMNKLAGYIKKDLEKVMPIQNVIERAKAILNQNELMRNKQSIKLNQQEQELCKLLK